MTCSRLNVLQPQGNNLHIVKEGDKLQELSRVPTGLGIRYTDKFTPFMSRPGFWDPVSEGIRRANPVLVTNCFKEKFY